MSFSQKFKPGYDARNSSLKISESKVFDGILYNLDAEVEPTKNTNAASSKTPEAARKPVPLDKSYKSPTTVLEQ